MSTDNYRSEDSKRGIIKSTTVISLGTLLSRVLGFIRDVIIARLLGTSAGADTFFVAFRIPNLFRDLVGEGATNSALVPVFSEYEAKKDNKQTQGFLNTFYALSFLILSAIAVLGILFAPLIVRLMAPGFIADAAKLNTTITLTRIMFPYLILIGLTAYSMGVLYTFRSFLWPSLSPSVLNIAMIVSVVVAMKTGRDPVFCLAIGVLAGGAGQFALQMKPLYDRGIRFSWPRSLFHPGVSKVGRLLLPRLFGSAIYQLNVIVDTFCASLFTIVGPGGIAAIYYSNRIVQLPMGLFSVSLASAILPSMAGFAARNDIEQFKKTIVFSLENIFLVMMPMTVFLVLLATPITRICFERGQFNSYSTHITSTAILFYSLGLVSFGGTKIMVTAFHSLQDTKTPVVAGFLSLVVNIVLIVVFIVPLKVGGIALASSAASLVNFTFLFSLLSKRIGKMDESLRPFLYKVGLASLLMGTVVFVVWGFTAAVPEFGRLAIVGLSGTLVFTVACFRFQIRQIQEAVKWILKER